MTVGCAVRAVYRRVNRTLVAVVVIAGVTSSCVAGGGDATPTRSSDVRSGSGGDAGSSAQATPTRRGSAARPPGPTPAGAQIDSASQARLELAQLPVVPVRPKLPGYDRSCSPGDACSFGPAWTDDQDAVDGHNGCGTRDDVLAAQLWDVRLRAGSNCVVIAGTLADPYTGRTIEFTKAQAYRVPLDHVVPLALAWDLGAAHWTQAERTRYANDPVLVLLAVDQKSNSEKSDSGPGEWMPADRGYWCAYDQRFVTILARYRLQVTAADEAAMSEVLAHC